MSQRTPRTALCIFLVFFVALVYSLSLHVLDTLDWWRGVPPPRRVNEFGTMGMAVVAGVTFITYSDYRRIRKEWANKTNPKTNDDDNPSED